MTISGEMPGWSRRLHWFAGGFMSLVFASFVVLSGALIVLGVWPRLILAPLNAGVAEFLTRLGI